jgi:endonuclease/exonuclease/phosphatase family metal-dependent hydrolase
MKSAAVPVLLLTAAAYAAEPLDRIYEGRFANGARFAPPLRVVTWNIHHGKRLDRVTEWLRAQEPDVVLLQEVDRDARRSGGVDVAAEMARRLGMNFVFAPAFEEAGQGTGNGRPALNGQALLARGEILNPRVLRFSRQTGFWRPRRWLPNWAPMQRRNGGRIALVAEVAAGESTVAVYNLHLESRGIGHTRRLQLEETLRDAGRYPPTVPVIIGGDLNTKYDPARTRERMARAGFRNCLGERNTRTHVLWGYLDWVFVRGPAECREPEVVRGTRASDHDPIVARLALVRR